MKGFVIYTQKLASYLMGRGFVLINMKENKQKPGFNVFIFNDSKELRDAIDEFKTRQKVTV